MVKRFERAYRQLNDQQRRAVDKIDGPVLVIAGPGTGKTQLLSMRVANILRQTDAKPSNILALTYTNKAAVNMKDRIIQLDSRGGPRVNASTFHSFAAEIMNLYPDSFWSGARLSIAPDSTQLDIIESIVSKLPLDNPLALKFAGQYTLLKDIQSSINLAKDAGLTPDKLRALIDVNLAYIDEIEARLAAICAKRLNIKNLPDLKKSVGDLPEQGIDRTVYPLTSLSAAIKDSLAVAAQADLGTRRTINTGRWKNRWVQVINGQPGLHKERDRNNWWRYIADVYDNYRGELHRRGYYDYSDMLVEVIAQLEDDTDMLADTQERFTHVLIDEFQDTTPAQIRLSHLVSTHFSTEGRPNLMVVGDDDQTIFKFNGAEVNNMLNFEKQYPSVKKVVLTDNYRSSQAILDFSEAIIAQAESRLVNLDQTLKKKLTAKAPPKTAGHIRTLAYSSRELQLSEIARDIKATLDAGESIAVLARGHESLIRMAGILTELKVPVRYEQSANILDHDLVVQVFYIAQLILAIQNGDKSASNALIHRIVRWPALELPPKALWELAAQNFKTQNWLDSMLASQDKKIKAVGQWFVWLASQADSQPLAVTIEYILGLRPGEHFTPPVREHYLSDASRLTNAYFRGLSAVQLLRNLAHEFGRGSQPTVEDLVRYIAINKQNGLIIPDESPFITGERAVQLLTVHKAKGLEFDRVYVIDAVADNWRPRAGGRKPPANLPLQPVGDDLDDYIRLMFVAVTRARSHLTISANWQDHSGRDVALSPIIQSVADFQKIESNDQTKIITVLEESLRWPNLSAGDETATLKTRLENYNLNVTAMLNFLDIDRGGPQYFKERNLLRLPEAKTASQAFGTAVHQAMKSAQLLAGKGKFTTAAVKKEFGRALGHEQLPEAEYRRQLAKGQQVLGRLFGELGYKLPKEAVGELQLRDLRLGKALISGDLDRVDYDGDQAIITDYKTGRPLPSFNTRDRNLAVKAYKHKMQIIFYVLLLEARGRYMPAGGQMVYVEATAAKDLSRVYRPSKEDKKRVAGLIEAIYQRIVSLNLPDISRYPAGLEGILNFEEDLLAGKSH